VNRAFYIIGIPAVITSFMYLAVGWGLRVAVPVTLAEVAAAIGAVIYLRRRKAAADQR
jgi:hypothetical protein